MEKRENGFRYKRKSSNETLAVVVVGFYFTLALVLSDISVQILPLY